MASHFVVVQYVPDPTAGERVNVGAIAYSDEAVRVQFLGDWRRIKGFGGEDIGFLRDFAHDVQRAVALQATGALPPGGRLDRDAIGQMATRWQNSIQFTEPRASLKEPEALLREVVQRFLSEPIRAVEHRRDRQQAANLATSRVRSAVKAIVGGDVAEALTKPRYAIRGDKQEHVFDVAVSNGVPYLAAHAVSLEGTESRQLLTTLDAIAWMIDDTRGQLATLPLGIVILPPRPTSQHRDSLERLRQEKAALYEELGARVLTEEQVEPWASFVLAEALPHDDQMREQTTH